MSEHHTRSEQPDPTLSTPLGQTAYLLLGPIAPRPRPLPDTGARVRLVRESDGNPGLVPEPGGPFELLSIRRVGNSLVARLQRV
jgi:hypothetical protein